MNNCTNPPLPKLIAASLAVAALLVAGCATHRPHAESHTHGANCGHVAIIHTGHTDYLHDGHLHHAHGSHMDEHQFPVSSTNPAACTPQHNCPAHPAGHTHTATCGHPAVPHGDHLDYLIAGHLHHPHGTHCDDHGAVQLADK